MVGKKKKQLLDSNMQAAIKFLDLIDLNFVENSSYLGISFPRT